MVKASLKRRSNRVAVPHPKTVAVIGGGFTGSLFALKLSTQQPDWTVLLVEEKARVGRGVAYGACAAQHLLNVPVSRMELGLTPSFGHWLGRHQDRLREALDESGGKLADAFAPRQLFGNYLEEQASSALLSDRGAIRHVRGTAVAISSVPRGLVLADGRTFPVDIVVLATGNEPPSFPIRARLSSRIIADPWKADVLKEIAPDASLLLIGSGLTMIDTVLSLRAQGHAGPIEVISRRGLLPNAHKAGGIWPAFMKADASPVAALRAVRTAVRDAEARGIPWQRVFDAVRPSIASIWKNWSISQRAQFLRHLRTVWDVHRHRMAERIWTVIQDLIERGTMKVRSGRVLALDEHKDGVTAVLRPSDAKAVIVEVSAVINCTGPQFDLRKVANPLLKDLLAAGLIRRDPLGLGLESEDCAVKSATGEPSDWLYALGPLTRPAWWEITAVPEITAQIDRLVRMLSREESDTSQPALAEVFLNIGAGI